MEIKRKRVKTTETLTQDALLLKIEVSMTVNQPRDMTQSSDVHCITPSLNVKNSDPSVFKGDVDFHRTISRCCWWD